MKPQSKYKKMVPRLRKRNQNTHIWFWSNSYWFVFLGLCILSKKNIAQIPTSSPFHNPQVLWPVVCRQERLLGTGILLPQDFCGKTMQTLTGQPIKKNFFFSNSPESLLAPTR